MEHFEVICATVYSTKYIVYFLDKSTFYNFLEIIKSDMLQLKRVLNESGLS